MHILKLLTMIFLAVFLVFDGLFNFFGYTPTGPVAFFLGLFAVASGILMLLSIKEFLHYEKR